MSAADPRPDLAAHAYAMRASFRAVAAELRELLGVRLVAYLAGVRETRAVHQWADETRLPSARVQQRLRLALQVARPIAEADGKETAQAWFQGINAELDNRSPARTLREGNFDEAGPAVNAAARDFLDRG
jgi:hypothetical protein